MFQGSRNGWGQVETRLGQMRSTMQLKPTSRSKSIDTATSGSSYDEEFQHPPVSLQHLPPKQGQRGEAVAAASLTLAKRNPPKKFPAGGGAADSRFRKPPLQGEYVNVSSIRRDLNANVVLKKKPGNEKRGNKNGPLPPNKASNTTRKPTEVQKGNAVVTEPKPSSNWRNYPKPWLQGISKYQTVVKAAREPEIGVGRKQSKLLNLPPPPDFVLQEFPCNNPIPLGPKTSVQMMIQSYEQKKPLDELSYDDALKSRFNWREVGRLPNLDLRPDHSAMAFLLESPAPGHLDRILENRMDQDPYSNALFYHQQTMPRGPSASTQDTIMSPRSPTDDYDNEIESDENESPRFGITMTSDGRTATECDLGSPRDSVYSLMSQKRSQNLRVHFDISPNPSLVQLNQRGSTYRLQTTDESEDPYSSRTVKLEQELIARPPAGTPLDFLFTPTPQPQSYASNVPLKKDALPLYKLNSFPHLQDQIPVQLAHRRSNTILNVPDQQQHQQLLLQQQQQKHQLQQQQLPTPQRQSLQQQQPPRQQQQRQLQQQQQHEQQQRQQYEQQQRQQHEQQQRQQHEQQQRQQHEQQQRTQHEQQQRTQHEQQQRQQHEQQQRTQHEQQQRQQHEQQQLQQQRLKQQGYSTSASTLALSGPQLRPPPLFDKKSQSTVASCESLSSQQQSQLFIPGDAYKGPSYPPLFPSKQQMNQLDPRMLLQVQSNQFFNGTTLDEQYSHQLTGHSSPRFSYQPQPRPGSNYYAPSSYGVPTAPPPTKEKMISSSLMQMNQRPPHWEGRIPPNPEALWNGQLNPLRQYPLPPIHQMGTDFNGNGPGSIQWIPYIRSSPGENKLHMVEPWLEKYGFQYHLLPPQEGETAYFQNSHVGVQTESSRGRPKKKKLSDVNNNYRRVGKIPKDVPAVSKVECGSNRYPRSISVPATPSTGRPLCFRDFKSTVGIHEELKMLEELRQNLNTRRSFSADSSCASVRVLLSSCKFPIVPTRKVPNQILTNAKDYGHKFCPCFECRRANGLYVTDSFNMSCMEQIDYVRKNIQDLKKYQKSVPNVPTVFVDTPKGDKTMPIVKFAGKKGYGKIPGYLLLRKKKIEHERAIRMAEEQKLAEEQALAEIESQKQEEYRRLFHKMERRRAAAKANFCMFKTDLESDPKWKSLEAGNTDSNYNCFLYMNGKVKSELLKMKEPRAPPHQKMPEPQNFPIVKINLDRLKPQKKKEPEIHPQVLEPTMSSPTPNSEGVENDHHREQNLEGARQDSLETTYTPEVLLPTGPYETTNDFPVY